jgi:hypothetical protein
VGFFWCSCSLLLPFPLKVKSSALESVVGWLCGARCCLFISILMWSVNVESFLFFFFGAFALSLSLSLSLFDPSWICSCLLLDFVS